MSDLREEMARGENAKRLLEDPILREALDKIKANAFEVWKTTPWDAKDAREELYRQAVAVEKLENELRKIIDGGKKAKSMLDKILQR